MGLGAGSLVAAGTAVCAETAPMPCSGLRTKMSASQTDITECSRRRFLAVVMRVA